jgi:hypothetical protein
MKVAPAVSETSNFFPLEVADVHFDTADSLLVTFAVPDALKLRFSFEPGQHLILRTTIDGTEVRRPYSICSAVQDDTLRIAIKRAQRGLFSNWAFTHLKQAWIFFPPLLPSATATAVAGFSWSLGFPSLRNERRCSTTQFPAAPSQAPLSPPRRATFRSMRTLLVATSLI